LNVKLLGTLKVFSPSTGKYWRSIRLLISGEIGTSETSGKSFWNLYLSAFVGSICDKTFESSKPGIGVVIIRLEVEVEDGLGKVIEVEDGVGEVVGALNCATVQAVEVDHLIELGVVDEVKSKVVGVVAKILICGRANGAAKATVVRDALVDQADVVELAVDLLELVFLVVLVLLVVVTLVLAVVAVALVLELVLLVVLVVALVLVVVVVLVFALVLVVVVVALVIVLALVLLDVVPVLEVDVDPVVDVVGLVANVDLVLDVVDLVVAVVDLVVELVVVNFVVDLVVVVVVVDLVVAVVDVVDLLVVDLVVLDLGLDLLFDLFEDDLALDVDDFVLGVVVVDVVTVDANVVLDDFVLGVVVVEVLTVDANVVLDVVGGVEVVVDEAVEVDLVSLDDEKANKSSTISKSDDFWLLNFFPDGAVDGELVLEVEEIGVVNCVLTETGRSSVIVLISGEIGA